MRIHPLTLLHDLRQEVICWHTTLDEEKRVDRVINIV